MPGSVFPIQQYKPLKAKDCCLLHYLVTKAAYKHLLLPCIQLKARCIILAVWCVIRDAEANMTTPTKETCERVDRGKNL